MVLRARVNIAQEDSYMTLCYRSIDLHPLSVLVGDSLLWLDHALLTCGSEVCGPSYFVFDLLCHGQKILLTKVYVTSPC